MNRRTGVAISSAMLAMLAACTAPSEKSDSTPAATAMSAGTLAEPNVGEIRTNIEAANQKAVSAMLAGDMSVMMTNYADSAVVMMPAEQPPGPQRARGAAPQRVLCSVDRLVDRLGTDIHVVPVWKGGPQGVADLLWAPPFRQPLRDETAQLVIVIEFAFIRSGTPLRRRLVEQIWVIHAGRVAVAVYLPADRRR